MSNPMPKRVNVQEPSVARIYDYFLGGKDNFAVDRQSTKTFTDRFPDVVDNARHNRAWVTRVVEYLANRGVDQFLDIGSGLPTGRNVHQVAQRAVPDVKVVYTDNDPIVNAHGRAALGGDPNTHYLEADARDPGPILECAAEHLDLQRPVAVLFAALLHWIPEEPATVTAPYMAAMPSGSFLAVSHVTDQDAPAEFTAQLQAQYGDRMWPRPISAIEATLDGMELVGDAITDVQRWRADPSAPRCTQRLIGAVGRKP
ncbi:SAM-dependent methyltransferase [Actinomadura nitritigenes]|uniref:SAM-dependent methyltransferase n=1 Tax=Actinomadura nitritigenes TaxID=134602 RepID=UPI003D8AD3F4